MKKNLSARRTVTISDKQARWSKEAGGPRQSGMEAKQDLHLSPTSWSQKQEIDAEIGIQTQRDQNLLWKLCCQLFLLQLISFPNNVILQSKKKLHVYILLCDLVWDADAMI